MKFAKRLISVLLSLSMLFSLIAQIGITAFAAEKEITNRAEWLSALAKTFQMTVESDNYPDNYFSDLTEASEYYYDVLLAVEFGVVDIEAGDPVDPEGEISREFAAQTLNFCLKFDLENLENEDYQYSFADYEICNYPNDDQVAVNRGWFALDEDGNFCPELTASSDELAFMIDDAKAVIKADAVDENYDSTYEFKDGVIEISSNTDVEILDDNTVVIYNTKYDIKNGDTFVVFSNDIPIVYQAEKVTVNKDNITIRVADKDCEDAVESIDMEEVVDLDASGFIPADGFEIVDEPVSAYSLRKAPSAKNSVNLKKKINLISGNSINIEIKISDIKASYKVKSKEESVTTKVDFNLSYKFDGQFNFTDIAQDDLDDLKSIGTIPFMGIGFIEFKPELNFNGKTEYSQKYNVVLGFTQDKSGTHNISSFKKDTFKFDFEGSCKFGIKVEIGLKILAVKIGVYAEVGAMAKASAETSENENNVSTYCLTLSAYLYFKVGVELKIDFLSWKSNPKIEWEIYKETNSPVRLYFHFENGKSVDRCTVGSKTKPKYVTPSTSQYGSVYEDNISDTGNIVSAGDFGLSTNSDGTATITDYTGSAANLSIPEYINGYRIISIGNWAFDYCTSLTNITIPNSVTSIGNGAFANCTSLESITIPNSVTSINDHAFYGCKSLTSITIENKNCEMGYDSIPAYVTIYGYKNSTTERYAKENGNKFVAIDAECSHTWGNGKVTKAATCTANGVKTYTCTNCGGVKTETIKATGHKSVTDKAVAATCTTAGKTAGSHCSVCNTVITAQKAVPATGHSYDAGKVTKQPTATATGVKTYTCTICGATKTETIPVTRLKAPTAKAVVNANGGFTISWNKVAGADKYDVYYDNGTGYKLLRTVTGTSTTTGTAPYGKKYSYKVRAVNSKNSAVTSAFSAAVTAINNKKLQTPTLKATVNANGSFKLSWNKVTGATRYGIYMLESNGKYKWIKSTSATSWTTGTAQYGKKYTYKVFAVNDNTSAKSAFSSAVSATNNKKLQSTTAKVTVNANGSFKISWNKVTGATKYGIYMKQANGSYKWIKTVTGTCWSTAVAAYGKQYSYKVLAANNNKSAQTFSNVVNAKNTKKLQTPLLKVAVNKNGSFKLSWGKVAGATSYQIYMKQANGSYKLMKTTSSTSFTTAVAAKGKTYSYKIKAVTSKNKNAASNYSNTVSAKRK